MFYGFYGADTEDVMPVCAEYSHIKNQRHLYELLMNVWCAETCAPRMRGDWSENNKTLGQCSITSFLIQDIFGGRVYGIPLPEGGYHCYNAVGNVVFDLTSEQFGGKELVYDLQYEQFRDSHFESDEKYRRYLLLRDKLKEALA